MSGAAELKEKHMEVFENKSPAMADFLAKVAPAGDPRLGKCATCGKPIYGFKDRLSKKEYGISGMCQECQDSVFE